MSFEDFRRGELCPAAAALSISISPPRLPGKLCPPPGRRLYDIYSMCIYRSPAARISCLWVSCRGEIEGDIGAELSTSKGFEFSRVLIADVSLSRVAKSGQVALGMTGGMYVSRVEMMELERYWCGLTR